MNKKEISLIEDFLVGYDFYEGCTPSEKDFYESFNLAEEEIQDGYYREDDVCISYDDILNFMEEYRSEKNKGQGTIDEFIKEIYKLRKKYGIELAMEDDEIYAYFNGKEYNITNDIIH
jgi:hypothetical protein